MHGHRLRVFERAAVGAIGSDADCTEALIAHRRLVPVGATRRRIMSHAADWFIGWSNGSETVALMPTVSRKPASSITC